MNHPFPPEGHIHVNLKRTSPDGSGRYDTAMQVEVKGVCPEDVVRALGVVARSIKTEDEAMKAYLDFVTQGSEMCLNVIGEAPTSNGIPDSLRAATGLDQN